MPSQGTPGEKEHNHLNDLILADPNFDKPVKVDLLIGCNALQDSLTLDMRKVNPQEPMAIRTVFGWAILGRYKPTPEQTSSQPALIGHTAAVLISDDLLK